VLFNQSLKIHFKFDFLSWIEFDWWFLEQLLALIINFSIGYASILRMTLNVMLILSSLIDLLLLNSSNHFLLFNIQTFQFGTKFHFLIVVEFD
jgi:hypothetical protein